MLAGFLASVANGADPAAAALIAHWTLDEPDGTVWSDTSGRGADVILEAGGPGAVERAPGVFGRALLLTGPHRLRVDSRLDFAGVERLTLSAWVRPTAFERYNEIFRKEDGDRRVLFAFQEHGTILALGLNVGGYLECDAPLDPGEVLDGQWHHCAATFDGAWLRVYLDGRELGALARSGPLVTGGTAPGYLGSMNGSECFQGLIDEVRFFREALAPADLEALYRLGQPALELFARQLDEAIAQYLVPGDAFAVTLARTRQRLAETGAPSDREVAAALVGRIKARHGREFAEFVRTTGIKPQDLLDATDPGRFGREGARLLELLVEYRPLTDAQWERQTPDDRRHWEDIQALEDRYRELDVGGDATRFSPAWIEWLLAAGRQVQLRPYAQEAVAPYVRPATPETRTLTAAEARTALERDWLHQADQNPTPDRIRAEIGWTRELAARIEGGALRAPDFTDDLAELQRLESEANALTSADRDLFFRVREVKRRIAFRNPVVDFDQVLFVDMPYPQGSEWPHETRHRLGYMAVPGGRLLVLEGLDPGGRLRQLLPQAPLHGSFWRPDLSWDARRVLVCFKPHNEKAFHLYEIDVDGTGFRQITDGPYDDLDPVYLPDDRQVVFSTTRGHTYVRCMPPTSAFVLGRCDLDGGNLFLISANNEPDYLPSVLEDGRLIYTRWEYTDKPLWRAQKLWTVRPDGTQVNVLWGNQSVWPDLLKDARQVPGSPRILFTGSAHHDWFAGSIGLLDPRLGLNFPDGLTKVTADVPWPECGNGPVDPIESPRYHRSGTYPAYYSPYPLGEQDFLVSAQRDGKFRLYLMDVDGNRELVYEGVHNVFHALPLKPRPRPPVLADTVAWPLAGGSGGPAPGVFYSSDVYQGAPAVLRGQARFLRVLSIDHKTYTYWHQRPYLSTGPVVSGVQSDGVKRILGTVPIEQDGSVAFEAPSGIPLHFQLLDADQRGLHTMRSFANLMPGESRGCLGCHERHSQAPATYAHNLAPLRLRTITPPPWDDLTVSYPRYVRPVLDRHCGSCHTGDGKGRATLDLTPRPGFLGFDESYWTLIGWPSWGQPYRAPDPVPAGWGIADTLLVEAYGTTDPEAYRTPEPMTRLSYRSRLIALAGDGSHHDVRVDPVELLRLMVWVDTMCPYRGEEEIRELPDPEFQGVDWLAVRPRIQSAPQIVRPGPLR
jgi:hypothetical protein